MHMNQFEFFVSCMINFGIMGLIVLVSIFIHFNFGKKNHAEALSYSLPALVSFSIFAFAGAFLARFASEGKVSWFILAAFGLYIAIVILVNGLTSAVGHRHNMERKKTVQSA